MKKYLLFFVLLCTCTLLQAQPCYNSFKIKRAFQATPVWCWAASLQMIVNFHHPFENISQCDIVKDCFGIDDCSEAALSGGYMSSMKRFLETNDLGVTFTCDYSRYPLSVEEIAENILSCKPIIVEIRTSPFSSMTHAVVIMGIWTNRDYYGNMVTTVVLRDPYPYNWNSLMTAGFNGISYNQLRNIWVSSLSNIEPD